MISKIYDDKFQSNNVLTDLKSRRCLLHDKQGDNEKKN